MDSNFFIRALLSLYPNSIWSIQENNYDTLEWLSEDIPKPSKEEIEAEALRLQQEWEDTEYQRLRAPEYPPVTELADALYWNSKGDSSHLDAYYAACQAVKDKYPKP